MNGTTVVKIVIHNLLTGEGCGISDCGCRIAPAFLRQQAGISDGLMLFYTKLSSSISDMVCSNNISHRLAR